MQQINRAEVYGPRSELSLVVDETTHRQLLRVIVPPESALRMARELRKH